MNAPIIIPTLNRIAHLQRCINSLLKSEMAKQTDVYISVDYPPSKKYFDGYHSVLDYVKTIKGFNKVVIYEQKENLGPGRNGLFLINEVKTKYDRYIYTEDDNEFSPTFLHYMNWALSYYQDDESVYSISSKADFFIKGNDKISQIRLANFNPYGTGYWVNKTDKCLTFLLSEDLDDIIYKYKNLKKVYKVSPKLYYYLISDIVREIPAMRGRDDKVTYIDIWINIYCILNDKINIVPIVPKSRNWGDDGSGVHRSGSNSVKKEGELLLEESDEWSPNTEVSKNCEKANRCQYYKENAIKLKHNVRAFVILCAYKMFKPNTFRKFKVLLHRQRIDEEQTIYYG